MRRPEIAVLLVAGAFALQPAVEARSARSERSAAQKPYVVVYHERAASSATAPARRTDALERRYGFESDARYRRAIPGFAARLTARQANELRSSDGVAIVAPDRIVRGAGRVPVLAGDDVPTGVSRIGAATQAGVYEPAGAAVAVIDTGIDLDHPDLNVAGGVNCVGNGPPEDDHDHGTYIAGIIGARNDGANVVGVAPGTKLYAVKALNSDLFGTTSTIICGIEWVTTNAAALGIEAVNMSLTTDGSESDCNGDPLHLAICNSTAAGVTYVAAVGNDAKDIGVPRPGLPANTRTLPAAYPEVLAATAMSDSDGLPGGKGGPSCGPGQVDDSYATFSNFATRAVDINHLVAAPGVCIRSTKRGGGYTDSLGTSAAAAHTTGVVALCHGQSGQPGPCSGLTSAEVIQQVRADAAASATLANGFVGDPQHPVGGMHFGHLVSAHDVSVQIERLRVRRLEGRSLLVVVRLAEAGTVEARATAKVQTPSARSSAVRRLRYRRRSAAAVPHRSVKLRLRLRPRPRRAARRALRAGRRLRVTVTVVARDRAGNSRRKHRRLVLGR